MLGNLLIYLMHVLLLIGFICLWGCHGVWGLKEVRNWKREARMISRGLGHKASNALRCQHRPGSRVIMGLSISIIKIVFEL
jgi:hypothetical protein